MTKKRHIKVRPFQPEGPSGRRLDRPLDRRLGPPSKRPSDGSPDGLADGLIDALPAGSLGAGPDARVLPCGEIDRRTFLKCAALAGLAAACPFGARGAGLGAGPVAGYGADSGVGGGASDNAASDAAASDNAAADGESRYVIEARHYEKLTHKKIRCTLCPRECVIDDMERGYCGVRENIDGTYYTLVHSRPCTYHADPIEKKPFFHVHPGTLAFSIATAGCNVNCKMCQNWEISQARPEQLRSIYMPPKDVANMARKYNCRSIAYTYSEPIIFFEYMMDAADAGHERDVMSVVVTGGYITEKPLRELCKAVDAIKVDLKAYSEKFYREIVNGEMKPVLDGLVTMREEGVWTEIVYLVVPTLNDSDEEFRQLAKWIRTNLGTDVPVHFTRFHPQYLLKNLPPTPVDTLERAKQIADAEGLHYVYIGNVPGHPSENTYCPGCGRAVVSRLGFTIQSIDIEKGACGQCGHKIAGVWGR